MKINKAFIAILSEYTNFVDVFFPYLATKLLENIKINNFAINLIDSKQLPYGPIHSLKLIELEILKTYIKTNLANSFIRPFKTVISTPIFFVWKSNNSF